MVVKKGGSTVRVVLAVLPVMVLVQCEHTRSLPHTLTHKERPSCINIRARIHTCAHCLLLLAACLRACTVSDRGQQIIADNGGIVAVALVL